MNAVLRAWLGFCALGAGLIHIALVIGSPLPAAIPLLVVGIAEFGWGVAAIAAGAVPFPRVARIAAVVPILGWVVALLAFGSQAVAGVRVVPMLVAGLLDLLVAIGITIVLRRADAATRPLSPARYLVGLAAGALVVAALTIPALAATEVGEGDPSPSTDLPHEEPDH